MYIKMIGKFHFLIHYADNKIIVAVWGCSLS